MCGQCVFHSEGWRTSKCCSRSDVAKSAVGVRECGHAICAAAGGVAHVGFAIVQGDGLPRKPGRARPSRGDCDIEGGLL